MNKYKPFQNMVDDYNSKSNKKLNIRIMIVFTYEEKENSITYNFNGMSHNLKFEFQSIDKKIKDFTKIKYIITDIIIFDLSDYDYIEEKIFKSTSKNYDTMRKVTNFMVKKERLTNGLKNEYDLITPEEEYNEMIKRQYQLTH